MEEEIEILEELIQFLKSDDVEETFDDFTPEILALGNILKAYKELKEELKKIDEVLNIEEGTAMPSRKCIIESLKGGIALLNKIVDNSIPKSKAREKIEEIDIKITYIESQYTNGGQNCDSDYLGALYQKQALQELLGEE